MNSEIVESFAQMVREKGIDKDILAGIVEDVFSMMVRKKFGQEAKFDVVVNMDKGDIEIFLERQVVETVEDPTTQIDVAAARKLSGEDLEIGDEYVEVVPLSSFGRRLVVSAKQNLNQRIKEIERELIYNEYSNAVGDIVVGEIYQIRRNEILVNHNRNELILPKSEQIFKERYKKGDTIRAVIKEVRRNAGNPVVVVSRADPSFLSKLFELEIPEIYDGIIEIKGIAREPGERAKVAVESHDDRIDAVGACVGMKGVRIHTIVRELNNENIDVINYTTQPTVYIQRSLAPAKLKSVNLNRETNTADVVVDADQVSLAIGRNGQNIRLASKLTGFEINLIKEGGEEEYDIDLIEFREELGDDLYIKLVEAGYESANDVIKADTPDLLAIPGLDELRVREIREMMKRDLEEAEVEEEEEEEELEEEEVLEESSAETVSERKADEVDLPDAAQEVDAAQPAEEVAEKENTPGEPEEMTPRAAASDEGEEQKEEPTQERSN